MVQTGTIFQEEPPLVTSMIQMFENSRYTENYKPTIGADLTAKIIEVDGIKV